jgi:hypothetical protein
LIGAHHLTIVFGVELPGKSRGVNQITEQHGELAAFCLRGVLDAGRRDTWDEMGFLDIRRRRTGGRRRDRRWGAGAARPDQYSVVLIHGELQHLDDFSGEILEVDVVELKLALEGTIRHAPPALKYSDRLVQELLKGHRPSSLSRGGVQKTVWAWDRPFRCMYITSG